MRLLRPLHVCLSVWSYSYWRKRKRRRIAAVLITATVAARHAVSISPFYQRQVSPIKFTAGMTYTYVPKGAEAPTGVADAGAGSDFG